MTTLREICTACAPESLERSPHLPLAHRKVISALCPCRSGHDGPSLSQCQRCGAHHRVQHACGNRHCPQGQPHTTQQWFHHHLEQQRPAPHCLLTFTVPETLRPCIRSQQRRASQALLQASARALKRLAQDERFLGTDLPGFTGVLHTWGRQLPYHPHMHSIVPGGGLSADRTAWRPSRANCFVPVKALSPIYRALWKEEIIKTGLLGQIAPQVWTLAWNVQSQAMPHAHAALHSLAPYVCKVALSNSRIVSLTDRTVTFTYRKPGSARLRTTSLDALELLRRFLQHVLPDGFLKVRHFGFMHASCTVKTDAIRLMIVPHRLCADQPPLLKTSSPCVASCPPWGGHLTLRMRLWTSPRVFVDTG